MDCEVCFIKRLIFALAAATMPLIAAPALARAGDFDAAFYVLLKGHPIGYHIVNVEETAEGLVVDTRVELTVKFGPLQLYRYRHAAHEVWRDGALQRLSSRTNDNGRRMFLEIARADGVLMIDGNAYKGPAPAEARTSSYWNRSVVDCPIVINTQNGELIDVDVQDLGPAPTPFVGKAEHYRVTGTLTLDVYYDGAKWNGADFRIHGAELTYEPVKEAADRMRLVAEAD
ncbi:MAG TPA: DUF6134 family protein [Parvularculaceae bacterium]|nr:DUF6134 family protein [Parvularculaceae bacterium]